MKSLILIKLGGSLITDKSKPFTENSVIIRQLTREIHQAKSLSGNLLIVGHGGGSYPHVPAAKYRTAEGIVNMKSYKGIAVVQDAAARLNRIIIKELISTGENAVALSPSSFMTAQNGEIKKAFLTPLLKLLELEMLPVVYGDVVLDLKQGCCILSTEKILNYLAKNLARSYKIERVIYCGKTDGVYGEKGKVIQLINRDRFNKLKKEIGKSEGIDVTGGMIHKVKEALKLAEKGIQSVIISGSKPGILKKAILGKKVSGTRVI